MDKKQLSEKDIITKFINPAIKQAGWDTMRQTREEWDFTDGRIINRGNSYTRGKRKRADVVLFYRSNPIALIEAKENNKSISAGMQQGKNYAEILDVPFIYATNGDGFIEHDRTKTSGNIERELGLNEFPSPEELWERYKQWKGFGEKEAEVLKEDNHHGNGEIELRYYQQVAVKRTVEAVAKGQKRIMLVMATGTGKTFTAFQIAWRLKQSKAVNRILFLVDRNILANQAKNSDFRPFGHDIMTKVGNRKVDRSYQVYFALYQSLTGTEEAKNIFKEFSPEFFDLVIVDECHRGSANEESAWRSVLEYFDSAVQIGMTATPKETSQISNIDYFGDPIYTYSLKQGIDDGFLAPYRVIRVAMDVDQGYRPEKDKVDKYGHEIVDRVYNTKDFDKNLVIDDRTQKVAEKISEYLKGTDRFAKTIVFCRDTEHAERMRMALVNENSDMVNEYPKYVVRITGDDEIGQNELYNFTSKEERLPVIATTSKLLTTGVDTKMVKVIALDSNINSMTEFKQIIGRGSRLLEEEGKVYFTIIDFRNNTEHFADPDFDGEPVQSANFGENETPIPPDPEQPTNSEGEEGQPSEEEGIDWPNENEHQPDGTIVDPPFGEGEDEGAGRPRKYYVDDVPVTVVHERVQYYGEDGKLVTESLKDYTKKQVQSQFQSLDEFLQKWKSADKKKAIIEELKEQGVFFNELAKEVGKDYDAFDLLAHVAFDQPPLTREERANQVRKQNYFTKYGEEARKVLEALLEKYADEGVETIEDNKVLKLDPIKQFGTPTEIVKKFGDKSKFEQAVKELEEALYKSA